MILKEELAKLVDGELSDSSQELLRCSTDASVFEVKPELVVYPRQAGDLKALVKFVANAKIDHPALSLTARAAGTCMSGGALNQSIILDFTKHFNHLGAVEQERITLEPGVYYRDLEKVTLSAGLILPSYTASKEICAVGGMVANNAAGEKTLAYGSTERFVESLSVILADGEEYQFGKLTPAELQQKLAKTDYEGEIYRQVKNLLEENRALIAKAKPKVSKNSAGYLIWHVQPEPSGPFDLAQLMVGAQGTLGLISKITLRLMPVLPVRQLLVITLEDLEILPEVVRLVLAARPESFECYDHYTFALAAKYLPAAAQAVITQNETKLTLLAEFAGNDEASVAAPLEATRVALAALKLSLDLPASNQALNYWQIRRSSFALLREHNEAGHRVAPFIDDVIVSPEHLAKFLPQFNEILQKHHMIYTIAGHIGNGNFHLIPLVNLESELGRTDLLKVAEEVFQLTFSFGGSMAGEHNDGIIRTPFLAAMYGEETVQLFAKIKQIFDPQNIFNPGKKVGGTLEYALAHLSHSNTSPHF